MGKHGPREVVWFEGRAYRRYPQSERRDLRVYFTSQRGQTLHRAIWESANGAIPDGHHIHHVDGDPLNNDLGNLEAVQASAHLAEHGRRPERVAESRRNIAKAREAAKRWHASPEGRKWHAEHAKRVAEQRPVLSICCKVCGGWFESRQSNATMCSNKCRAKDRRDSGVDNEVRRCEWCRGMYSTNRFKESRFCSPECFTYWRNRSR